MNSKLRIPLCWKAFPDLQQQPDRIVNLIYLEVLYREGRGERPTEKEYLARFPDLDALLDRVFAAHAVLEDTLAPPSRTLPEPPEPLPPPFPEPTNFPGHEILEEIGRGGMGVVYKARHLALNRIVALKMIRDSAGASAVERKRLLLEAEATARLSHPNIVHLYEVGEHQGQPYFSMEFIDGVSLARKLDGTPLGGRAAAALVQTLARAVHAAHQAGVVHRDLKPANVLIDAQGTPKVVDFGLAKRIDAEGLTRAGTVIGTPSYMAPEQARGNSKEVGPAADVWALGAILYECLTGRPPFQGENAAETTMQVLTKDPVPPLRLNPRTPRDLETICLKCLEKSPSRRYLSAEALANDLERFLEGRPIEARPAGIFERAWKTARRNPVWTALTASAVTALAALLILTGVYDASLARKLNEIRLLEDALGNEREVVRRANAEAQHALYQARFSAAWQAYMRNDVLRAMEYLDLCQPDRRGWEWRLLSHLGHADLLSYTEAKDLRCLALSPGGQRLAAGLGEPGKPGVVLLRDLAGGSRAQRLEGHTRPIVEVVFSPGGRRLATASAARAKDNNTPHQILGEAILWDVAGPEAKRLETLPGCSNVAFSPDGQFLAWSGPDHAVVCRDRKTGRSTALYRHDASISRLVFGPGGLLASVSENVPQPDPPRVHSRIRVWNVKANRPVGDFERKGERVSDLAFDPAGPRLALAGLEHHIVLVAANTGREVGSLRGRWGTATAIAFSPDGGLLAVGGMDRLVSLWDVASGEPRGLLRGHAAVVKKLAFDSFWKGEDWRLASWDLSGTVKLWSPAGRGFTSLRGHQAAIHQVAFRPDSSLLASASADGTVKVWDVKTNRLLHTLSCQAATIAFSPDGMRLALAERESATPGRAGRVLLWQTDGDAPPRELFRVEGRTIRGATFHPDGTRLAVIVGPAPDRPPPSADAVLAENVVLIQASDGQVVAEYRTGAAGARAAAFSPDGGTLAVGGRNSQVQLFPAGGGNPSRALTPIDGNGSSVVALAYGPQGRLAVSNDRRELYLWDAAAGRRVWHTHGHSGNLTDLVFSRDGERLVGASLEPAAEQGEVKLWDADSGEEMLSLQGSRTAAFSPDGRFLAAPLMDFMGLPPVIRVWQTDPGRFQFALRPRAGAVGDLALAPGEGPLASGQADYTIRLWDRPSGPSRQVLRGHTGAVLALAIRKDGKLLASGSADRTARLWPLTGEGEAMVLQGHAGPVRGVAFTPDGKRVATASADGTVGLWDAGAGRKQGVLQGGKAGLFRAAFSPDGTVLAAGDESGAVILWDVARGVELRRWKAHDGAAFGVAFHPDGERLFTCGQDTLIQVWKWATGEKRGTFRGHRLGVLALAVSADGKRLASGARDRTVRVWDVEAGRELLLLRGHNGSVRATVFAPDGKLLYSGGERGTVRSWDVGPVK